MSIEALAILGVDYAEVEVQALVDEAWLPDLKNINNEIGQQLKGISEGFNHRWDENNMMRRKVNPGRRNTFPSVEVQGYHSHGENGECVDAADGDDRGKCMKIKFRQWARAVASYVILLDMDFKCPSAAVT